MHWQKWVVTVLISLALVIFGVGFVSLYAAPWTGFAPKVLWDWLELLLIPAVLAGGGLLFTWFENQQTRKIEAKRIEQSQNIERNRTQDTLVTEYLDQMTDLLLSHGLRTSSDGDEVQSVARVRTLTVLRRVDDSVRKANIIQFLYEARLIGYAEWTEAKATISSVIDLHGADLSGINFAGKKFVGIDLSGADLIDVNFNHAELQYAHFQDTFIAGASFRYAHLQCSHFTGATLQEDTDLTLADFHSACFRKAKLSDVTLFCNRFHRADFTDARVSEIPFTSCILDGATFARCDVTFEQLEAASSLHGTQLPDTIIGTDFGDKWLPPHNHSPAAP